MNKQEVMYNIRGQPGERASPQRGRAGVDFVFPPAGIAASIMAGDKQQITYIRRF